MKDNNLLVEELRQRQDVEGWSDREMARQIGVDHTTWRGIKIGRHGPGVTFIRRAVHRFPEYNALALLFLQSDVIDTNVAGTLTNTKAEVA